MRLFGLGGRRRYGDSERVKLPPYGKRFEANYLTKQAWKDKVKTIPWFWGNVFLGQAAYQLPKGAIQGVDDGPPALGAFWQALYQPFESTGRYVQAGWDGAAHLGDGVYSAALRAGAKYQLLVNQENADIATNLIDPRTHDAAVSAGEYAFIAALGIAAAAGISEFIRQRKKHEWRLDRYGMLKPQYSRNAANEEQRLFEGD